MKKLRYFAVALLMAASGLLVYRFNESDVSAAVPYVTNRANLTSAGVEANGATSNGATLGGVNKIAISLNGRYIAFTSAANNLVANDTNNAIDAFVKDTITGNVTRVNVSSSGAQAVMGVGSEVAISKNGRYVVFASGDTTMISGSYLGNYNRIFRHDMQTGVTSLVSSSYSRSVDKSFGITADGRYVVYLERSDAVPNADGNSMPDVFVKDMQLNTYTNLSKSYTGTASNNGALGASISCDGSKVAFASYSTNILASDPNGANTDVYLVNRIGGDTVSNITSGGNASVDSAAQAVVSCDSSTVLYRSSASNLVTTDTNGAAADLFAYDIATSSTEIVSLANNGTQLSQSDNVYSTSADGSLIAFSSSNSNAVSGDTNNVSDVFLRNRTAGTTERISMRNATTQTTVNSVDPYISPEGTVIGYVSGDTGLVASDTNGVNDVFVSSTGASACKE